MFLVNLQFFVKILEFVLYFVKNIINEKVIFKIYILVIWMESSKIIRNIPKKCLVIAAPHTSNWDFLIGRCYAYIIGIVPKYLMKSELFLPIIGNLFKWNGGIPVYRDSNNNIVDQISEIYNFSEDFILGISPEGTRKELKNGKQDFIILRLIHLYLFYC